MRPRLPPVVLVVVLLVAGLVGCGDGSGGGANDGTGGGASGKVYGPGDSITVAQGQTFVIELDANPTTGYMWSAEANPNADFVKSRQRTSSTLIGAPGVQQLTFRATKPGSSTLVLDYARSFEPDQPPARTESFPLTVT